MEAVWSMWIWVACAVPVLYALDCILDVFFVDREFYRNPVHASIITGLFSGLVLVFLIPGYELFQRPDFPILFLAVANGMIYLLHIYFYFMALYRLNDAANLETCLGFSIFLVPVMAFFLFDQQIGMNHVLGIASASAGVILLNIASLGRGRMMGYISTMGNAIILLSVTFVIQDQVYNQIGFYTGLVLFLAGKLLAAVVLWAGSECRGVIEDAKRFSRLFLFSQLIGILAVIVVQRAINLAPYVTIVVAFESLTPVCIMLFSLFLVPLFSSHRGPAARGTREMLMLQLEHVPAKVIATILLVTGIILMDNPVLPDLGRNLASALAGYLAFGAP